MPYDSILTKRTMKSGLRKLLILGHRYLGMALSLLFLMWFVTGIGMMYSRGMPRLTPEMRLARLAPIDMDAVRMTPGEAASRAGLLDPGGQTTLLTVLDRPAYRFDGRVTDIVFADTGERFGALELDEAIRIAARFVGVPEARVRYDALMTAPDQWTLTQGRQLPMYKLAVDDAAGSEIYVSARLGEVVQFTTRRGRALSWISVIPHFMYFEALRMRADLWSGIMTWGAGLGVVLAALGIALGVIHFRPKRPFRVSRIRSCIPYTGGLRWHVTAGLVFGVLTLTFAFSGFLSLEPFEWSLRDFSLEDGTRAAFPPGTGSLADYPPIDAAWWRQARVGAEIKEVAFARILGEPHFVARGAPAVAAAMGWPDGGHQPYFVQRSVDPQRTVIAVGDMALRKEPIATETILSTLGKGIPGVGVLAADMLDAYDAYYYSREQRSPLPVLRVKLDDADDTWLYIDPYVAQVVGRVNRVNRAERWLYAGLHTFDFPFLYDRRPLWDIVIIVFCLGGALLSGLGVVLGFKRIVRGVDRMSAVTGHR